MSAVLVALPAVRPSVADDCDERTQLFRPTQKRPTWKDVERERARSSTPADTRGSSPVPVLRLAPKPPKSRPSSKPAAQLPPYLRPGYVFPEALTIEQKHARDTKSCQEGLERIRSVPKNLAALLKTPEWKGARIVGTTPSPEISQEERELAARQTRLADVERGLTDLSVLVNACCVLAPAFREERRAYLNAQQKTAIIAADALRAQEERLAYVRAAEWIRVEHPSGAVLTVRPEWAE